jgi:magnesium transporter
MQFELTTGYLDSLREAISSNNDSYLREQLAELYPADIAEILNHLDFEDTLYVYRLLDEETAADVLLEVDDDHREQLLAQLSSKEIAEQVIDNMESDDAADVISELPDEKQDEVLSHMEDTEQASDIVDLLNYDENTAGGLMAKELIHVNVNKNVLECVREMRRQAEDVETVYTIYVVDDDEKLLGTLSLKRLLVTPLRTKVKDVYNPDVIFVKASTPSEEVANIMDKYDLVVLPVVDSLGRLVGRITIDDIVDVIREEADKDIQMMSGLSGKTEATDRFWTISKARLPWLMVGFIGELINSRIIGGYEGQLIIHPEMAFFMPLIAAMGGSVGVQSSSIVVQGLATNALSASKISVQVLKELNVSILNGFIFSCLIMGFNLYLDIPFRLSITISLSLFAVILFASFLGTLVPLLLKRFNIDPALATGPFITTLNDILAMFLYFTISMLMF